ncbi:MULTISPECIES: ABC transporter ATP-binding protein [unclassified Pseudomonas]|uniref:ABC transporter ATP-binding protein n=1 Tax=unclassified Pseudomonas TaxID=196821 RepID=UPI000BC6689F|nr:MULTISPECIES: ABC transporter ATP-binding protein [unclassified Pseudomonas]PVZ19675.1 putative spermidine/putrescine transport system ATP-binding protein [Pseudomonas sp. URIL14HWK12:I12]PVZ22740.1 putative spermidine/putrescine transport system ATP-binding protein [Pseudomonas sp. URIL14HWK12:I10]PVZ37630.1 putative spermidine/putrescine transport system ATP-binding protein [Pseudomonas sp. URIL14HWK12:I11]SNZ15302.1 putative spermidine/putrescine transport system ATP-binding protein [Pseu
MPSSSLTVRNLAKRYGDFVALANTDLEVAEGEFLTLLGPSGSGKTTLLTLVAGLAHPDEGEVMIGDNVVTFSAPHSRDIGVVFQNYALFPHMTVLENIAFPLKMRHVPDAQAQEQAMAALNMIKLPHIAQRYPKELSGGQQQRVALARCMVYRPAIILMDEPLGALDKKLREHMQLEIKRIHRELGTTIIYVTHDQEEAMTMSDRICLMNAGQIEQLGTPDELYFRPRTLFAADFLGESNLLPATVAAAGSEHAQVRVGSAQVNLNVAADPRLTVGQPLHIMVRPQNVRLLRAAPADGQALAARVTDVMVTGSLTKVYLQAADSQLPVLAAAFATRAEGESYAIGDPAWLAWEACDAVAIIEQAGG